jgi:hypothetical protein
MSQFLENSQALFVQRICRVALPLLPSQAPQICQGSGNAPAIANFAKDGQTLLIKGVCGRRIALIASDISFIVQRPGNSGLILERAEYRAALLA